MTPLPSWWRLPSWPDKLAAMERETCGMGHPSGSIFPGRLQISDEGGEIVHLDMYRANEMQRMRISVSRDVLRLYAQKLLEAANREVPTEGWQAWKAE
jgi:hypothetical protein